MTSPNLQSLFKRLKQLIQNHDLDPSISQEQIFQTEIAYPLSKSQAKKIKKFIRNQLFQTRKKKISNCQSNNLIHEQVQQNLSYEGTKTENPFFDQHQHYDIPLEPWIYEKERIVQNEEDDGCHINFSTINMNNIVGDFNDQTLSQQLQYKQSNNKRIKLESTAGDDLDFVIRTFTKKRLSRLNLKFTSHPIAFTELYVHVPPFLKQENQKKQIWNLEKMKDCYQSSILNPTEECSYRVKSKSRGPELQRPFFMNTDSNQYLVNEMERALMSRQSKIENMFELLEQSKQREKDELVRQLLITQEAITTLMHDNSRYIDKPIDLSKDHRCYYSVFHSTQPAFETAHEQLLRLETLYCSINSRLSGSAQDDCTISQLRLYEKFNRTSITKRLPIKPLSKVPIKNHRPKQPAEEVHKSYFQQAVEGVLKSRKYQDLPKRDKKILRKLCQVKQRLELQEQLDKHYPEQMYIPEELIDNDWMSAYRKQVEKDCEDDDNAKLANIKMNQADQVQAKRDIEIIELCSDKVKGNINEVAMAFHRTKSQARNLKRSLKNCKSSLIEKLIKFVGIAMKTLSAKKGNALQQLIVDSLHDRADIYGRTFDFKPLLYNHFEKKVSPKDHIITISQSRHCTKQTFHRFLATDSTAYLLFKYMDKLVSLLDIQLDKEKSQFLQLCLVRMEKKIDTFQLPANQDQTWRRKRVRSKPRQLSNKKKLEELTLILEHALLIFQDLPTSQIINTTLEEVTMYSECLEVEQLLSITRNKLVGHHSCFDTERQRLKHKTTILKRADGWFDFEEEAVDEKASGVQTQLQKVEKHLFQVGRMGVTQVFMEPAVKRVLLHTKDSINQSLKRTQAYYRLGTDHLSFAPKLKRYITNDMTEEKTLGLVRPRFLLTHSAVFKSLNPNLKKKNKVLLVDGDSKAPIGWYTYDECKSYQIYAEDLVEIGKQLDMQLDIALVQVQPNSQLKVIATEHYDPLTEIRTIKQEIYEEKAKKQESHEDRKEQDSVNKFMLDIEKEKDKKVVLEILDNHQYQQEQMIIDNNQEHVPSQKERHNEEDIEGNGKLLEYQQKEEMMIDADHVNPCVNQEQYQESLQSITKFNIQSPIWQPNEEDIHRMNPHFSSQLSQVLEVNSSQEKPDERMEEENLALKKKEEMKHKPSSKKKDEQEKMLPKKRKLVKTSEREKQGVKPPYNPLRTPTQEELRNTQQINQKGYIKQAQISEFNARLLSQSQHDRYQMQEHLQHQQQQQHLQQQHSLNQSYYQNQYLHQQQPIKSSLILRMDYMADDGKNVQQYQQSFAIKQQQLQPTQSNQPPLIQQTIHKHQQQHQHQGQHQRSQFQETTTQQTLKLSNVISPSDQNMQRAYESQLLRSSNLISSSQRNKQRSNTRIKSNANTNKSTGNKSTPIMPIVINIDDIPEENPQGIPIPKNTQRVQALQKKQEEMKGNNKGNIPSNRGGKGGAPNMRMGAGPSEKRHASEFFEEDHNTIEKEAVTQSVILEPAYPIDQKDYDDILNKNATIFMRYDGQEFTQEEFADDSSNPNYLFHGGFQDQSTYLCNFHAMNSWFGAPFYQSINQCIRVTKAREKLGTDKAVNAIMKHGVDLTKLNICLATEDALISFKRIQTVWKWDTPDEIQENLSNGLSPLSEFCLKNLNRGIIGTHFYYDDQFYTHAAAVKFDQNSWIVLDHSFDYPFRLNTQANITRYFGSCTFISFYQGVETTLNDQNKQNLNELRRLMTKEKYNPRSPVSLRNTKSVRTRWVHKKFKSDICNPANENDDKFYAMLPEIEDKQC